MTYKDELDDLFLHDANSSNALFTPKLKHVLRLLNTVTSCFLLQSYVLFFCRLRLNLAHFEAKTKV